MALQGPMDESFTCCQGHGEGTLSGKGPQLLGAVVPGLDHPQLSHTPWHLYRLGYSPLYMAPWAGRSWGICPVPCTPPGEATAPGSRAAMQAGRGPGAVMPRVEVGILLHALGPASPRANLTLSTWAPPQTARGTAQALGLAWPHLPNPQPLSH